MGIVEFLEARIAEDEAVALGASVLGVDWLYVGEGDPGFPTYEGVHRSNSRREKICHEGTAHENVYVTFDWHVTCDCVSSEEGAHITRHDPARALREVAAKRELLELHYDGNPGPGDTHYCETCHDYDKHDAEDWPCETVRVLASTFSDHPDFDEEWRP